MPQFSLATIAARAASDRQASVRPLSSPVVRSCVFAARSSQEHAALFKDGADTFYMRFGHPSEATLAGKLAALEGAEGAAVFASGMAAISTTLLAHLPPGSHVVAGVQIFEQTERIIRWLAADRGIKATFVDTRDVAAVAKACNPSTRAIYAETPSNPTLRISDIAALAQCARDAGALLFVDSTFATPIAQRPLSLGASLVLHSGTKLINGHMDAMCGIVAGPRDLLAPILELRRLLGGVLDPAAAWLVERGLRTLHVRAERAFENARAIADHLASVPVVAAVYYPHLPQHQHHDVALRQMSYGGSVVGFRLHGGIDAARRFLDRLQLISIATSLGGVESVIELPFDLDWVGRSAPEENGTEGGYIRLSLGLESLGDLLADLDQALEVIPMPAGASPLGNSMDHHESRGER